MLDAAHQRVMERLALEGVNGADDAKDDGDDLTTNSAPYRMKTTLNAAMGNTGIGGGWVGSVALGSVLNIVAKLAK